MDSNKPTSIKFTAEKYKNTKKKRSQCANHVAIPDDKIKPKDSTQEITNTEYVFVCDAHPVDKYCLRGKIVRSRKTSDSLESNADKFGVHVCPKEQVKTKTLDSKPSYNVGKDYKGTKSYRKHRTSVKQCLNADATVSKGDNTKLEPENSVLKMTIKNVHDQNDSKSRYEVLGDEQKLNSDDNSKSLPENKSIHGRRRPIQTSKEMSVIPELKCQFCCEVFKRQADLEYHYFHHFGSFDELYAFLNKLRSNQKKIGPELGTNCQTVNSCLDPEKSQNNSTLNSRQLVCNDKANNCDGNGHICEQPDDVLMEETTAHSVGNIAANEESTEIVVDENSDKRKTKCNGNEMTYNLLNSESKNFDERNADEENVKDVEKVVDLPDDDQETKAKLNTEKDTGNASYHNVQMNEVPNNPEESVEEGKDIENIKSLRQNCRELTDGCQDVKSQCETDVTKTSVHEKTDVDNDDTHMLKNNATNNSVKQGSCMKGVGTKDEEVKTLEGDGTCEKGFTDIIESDMVETNSRIKSKTFSSTDHCEGRKLKPEMPEIHNSLISTSSHCVIENDEPEWIFRCSEKKTPRTPLSLKKLKNFNKGEEDSNSNFSQSNALEVPSKLIDRPNDNEKSSRQNTRRSFRQTKSATRSKKRDLDTPTKSRCPSNLKLQQIKNSVVANREFDRLTENSSTDHVPQLTKANMCNRKYERQIEVQLKLVGLIKRQQDNTLSSDSVSNVWNNNDTLDSGFGSTPCVADELSVSDDSSSSYRSSIIDDGDSISINFLEDNCVNDKKEEEPELKETQIKESLTNSFSDKKDLHGIGRLARPTFCTGGMMILDELDLSEDSDSTEANDNDELNRQTEKKYSVQETSTAGNSIELKTCHKVNLRELETSKKVGTSNNVKSSELDACKEVNSTEIEANAGGGKPDSGLNRKSATCVRNSQPSRSILEGLKSCILTRQKLKNGGCTENTMKTGDEIPLQKIKLKAKPQAIHPFATKIKCSPEKSRLLKNKVSGPLFYRCEKCNRRYKSVTDLHKHWLDNEHYNLTLEPITYNLYTCLYCEKKFMTKLMINLHLRTCCDRSRLKVAKILPSELVRRVVNLGASPQNSPVAKQYPEIVRSLNTKYFNKPVRRQHVDVTRILVLCLKKLKMANFECNGVMYKFNGSVKKPCWKLIRNEWRNVSELDKSRDAVVSIAGQPCGTSYENKSPAEVTETLKCRGVVSDERILSISRDVVEKDKLKHVPKHVEMKEKDHALNIFENLNHLLKLKDNAKLVCSSNVSESVGKESRSETDSSTSVTDDNLKLPNSVSLLKKSGKRKLNAKEKCNKNTQGKWKKKISTFLTDFEKALMVDSGTPSPKKVRKNKPIEKIKLGDKKMDTWVIPKPRLTADGRVETRKHFNASKIAQNIFSKDQKRAMPVCNNTPVTMYETSIPSVRQNMLYPMTQIFQSDSRIQLTCQDLNIQRSLPQNQVNDCQIDKQALSVRSLKHNLKSALGLKNPSKDEAGVKPPFSSNAVTFSPPHKKQKVDGNETAKLPSFSESFSRLSSASRMKNFKQFDSSSPVERLNELPYVKSVVHVSSSKTAYTSTLSYSNNVLKVSFCTLKSDSTSQINSCSSLSHSQVCTDVMWSSLPRCIPSAFIASNSQTPGSNQLPVCSAETVSGIDVNFHQSHPSAVSSVLNGLDPNWGSEPDQPQITDSHSGSISRIYQHPVEDISASGEMDVPCGTHNGDVVNQADMSNMTNCSLDMSGSVGNNTIEIDFLDNISLPGDKDMFNLVTNDDNSNLLSDMTGMSSFDSFGKEDQMLTKLSEPLSGTPEDISSVLDPPMSHKVSPQKAVEMHKVEQSYLSTQLLVETTEKQLMSVPADCTVEKEPNDSELKTISDKVIEVENEVEDSNVGDEDDKLHHDDNADRSLKELDGVTLSNELLLDDKNGFVRCKSSKEVNLLQSHGNDVNSIDLTCNFSFKDDNLESENEMSHNLVLGLEDWLREKIQKDSKDINQVNGNELNEQTYDNHNLIPTVTDGDGEIERDDHDENNNIEVNKKDNESGLSKDTITDFGEKDLSENIEQGSEVSCDKLVESENVALPNLEDKKSLMETKIEDDDFKNTEADKDVHICSEVDKEKGENSEAEKNDEEEDIDKEINESENGIDNSYSNSDMLEDVTKEPDDETPGSLELDNEDSEEDEEIEDDAISIYVSDDEAAFLFDDVMVNDAKYNNDKKMCISPLGSDNSMKDVKIDSETMDSLNVETIIPSENSLDKSDMTVNCDEDARMLTQPSTSQTKEPNMKQTNEGSFIMSANSHQTGTPSEHYNEQIDIGLQKTSLNVQLTKDCSQAGSQNIHRKVHLVAEVPQLTRQNTNNVGTSSYKVDDQHRSALQTEALSQKTCWVPKGYCFKMFKSGGCVGQCNYKHTLPSENDLQKSIPYVVECIKTGDVDRVMCIMEDYLYFQKNLNPEVLNILFDLCCRHCQLVNCLKLLFLFLSRGFVNRGHIDCIIFLWNNSCKDVEDLSPLQNALTVATRTNILPQKDAIHILLQSFAESGNVFCLWETIVFCLSHGFLVPAQYTLYSLDAAINCSDVSVLHKVITLLKSVDRTVLDSVSDEMLNKLQMRLEELNEYEAASSIQYLIDSKHYEFTSTTSAPLRSRPTTPVLLGSSSHTQEHQESSINRRLGILSGTQITSASAPVPNRVIKLTAPSVVCSKPVELRTSMQLFTSMPTKDEIAFIKLIENASKTKNLKQLACLFVNRSRTHGTYQPCILRQFILALTKDKQVLGDVWRQFVEFVSSSYYQKLSKNSSTTLDTAGLSFIGCEIFHLAYDKNMWSHASSVMLTILGSELLELSPLVEQQRGVSLIAQAMTTFINDKMPEKAAELVQVFSSHLLRIDVKTEIMSLFVTLMTELCERKKFSTAHQLLNTAFVWNYLGVHEMSSELINRCLRANKLDIPIEIFNHYLSHKIPFSIPASVKRLMMNMLLATKEFPVLADNLYNDIRLNTLLYTPQSFIKPRRLVLPSHYSCYEVRLVIRDYLLGLYNYFCELWPMKHKLMYQELNLTVLLTSEVDLSGDSMLQLLGELPLTVLSVKNIFLREFGLHSVSLGQRSEFVLQTTSLEKYLKDLDLTNRNIGIEFTSSMRYR